MHFSGTPEVVVCASYYPFQPNNNSFGFGQMVCYLTILPLLVATYTHLIIHYTVNWYIRIGENWRLQLDLQCRFGSSTEILIMMQMLHSFGTIQHFWTQININTEYFFYIIKLTHSKCIIDFQYFFKNNFCLGHLCYIEQQCENALNPHSNSGWWRWNIKVLLIWGHVVFYLDASPQQASLVLLFTPMLNLIGGQFPGFSPVGGAIWPSHSYLGSESPFDSLNWFTCRFGYRWQWISV